MMVMGMCGWPLVRLLTGVLLAVCAAQAEGGLPACSGSPYIVSTTGSSDMETEVASAVTALGSSACAAEVMVAVSATFMFTSAYTIPQGSLTIDASQVPPLFHTNTHVYIHIYIYTYIFM